MSHQLAYDQRAQQLRDLDDVITAWMGMLREYAVDIDSEQLESLVETAQNYALDMDERLPPDLDPADVAEIRGILIGALRRLKATEKSRPLDVLDDFLLRAESIRHILRDALNEELPVEESDAGAVLELLVEWLPRVPKKQIADLAGIDVRTMQRWMKDGAQTPRRLSLAARLVSVLRGSWTSEGVVAWFERPRRELDGKSPLRLLDEPEYERAILDAARRGRAQHGS